MRTAVVVMSLALAAIVIAGCSTLNTFGSMLSSQVTFTQPQLQRSLDRNFPREFDKLAGLATLRLEKPGLSIPYDSNRLRLSLNASAVTGARAEPRQLGRILITSGLRFDPQTLGLHLQDPVIETIDSAGGSLNDASRELINGWLAAFAIEEPIYRLDHELVQRLVARRIGAARIDNGVVVLDVSQ
ncbi:MULTISPECIES: DUF1439 domain-containing protein [Lysobacteraceae]|uniref:DUF1439 domain-containing protein n=1 Tax=Novilysobacter avium TaxID=2781023 RepID=A0A7S6UM26_9GAMM|nr:MULTISPECIES: DUF1439 domain-containing protein [Lysobacter]QOW22781.1 DUF1439 domain-containing protein [Lysobacter avium]QOW25290.1 DUF1439 domain-containing protein [Lysobacter sp. H23M47]